MKSKLVKAVAVIALISIVWIVFSSGEQGRQSELDDTSSEAKKDPSTVEEVSDKKRDTPPSLHIPAVRDETIPAGSTVDNAEQAQHVIDDKSGQLQLGDDSVLTVDSSSSDDYGNSYYQIEQYYKTVPVYGTSSVLEVEQGQATVISGSWIQDIALEIAPSYQPQQALRLALDKIGVDSERQVTVQGPAKLIVFPSDQGIKLCWLMQARLSMPDSASEIFIVDAHMPEILIRHEASLQ